MLPDWLSEVGIEVPALCIALAALVISWIIFIRHLHARDAILVTISGECHATSREGYKVNREVTAAIGQLTESNHALIENHKETRQVLRDLGLVIRRVNGGG